jgi:hypothetical protein
VKSKMFFYTLALVCVFSFGNNFAQDKAKQDEMMKKWMEAATPNENHKKLNDLVGRWETTMSTWMNGPDKPPIVDKGSSELKWVLDGRFLMQESKGNMMGQPFSGMGFTGYDNLNKNFVSFWIDNSSTAMFTSEGNFDQTGKVLNFFGTMNEPMTGEHGKAVKYVLRMVDKDKWTFEFHDFAFPEGKTKVGEIIYTRIK